MDENALLNEWVYKESNAFCIEHLCHLESQ